MGQIVKQVSESKTRYYWYPGDKKEWIRSGIALAAGLVLFGALYAWTGNLLLGAVLGAAATAAVAGLNFGRRDARALAGFPDLGDRAARRAAVGHTGRAVWRALAHGFGGAAAAVLITNLPPRGFVADWVLPLVPALVGALTHQLGMLYERAHKVAEATIPPPVTAAAQAAPATH
jgi:hypothetical protein